MKRSREDDPNMQDEEEEAEMSVDEEKADRATDNAEEQATVDTTATPFLDTFYGLSSIDPQERAQAGQAMLFHCLLGADANIQDAAYALNRLINALCSGRAAARQGNASALTSFLRIAVERDVLKDIQQEILNEQETLVSDLHFVRQRILTVTEPGQGKRKGSEERDYKFGRLFGILAVVKSGILLPKNEANDDCIDVTKNFASDLIELYRYKKWMREPAAHGLCMLLNSFYALGPFNSGSLQVLETVVNQVIVPVLLVQKDTASQENVLATWSAEQLAVAINIQSHIDCHPNGLPAPLDQVVLSQDTLPLVAHALSETSAVTQPRTHLVWDAIWNYLTEKTSSGSGSLDMRKPKTPMGDENVAELVSGILQNVIVERLLCMDDASKPGKTTHQRCALAQCLVRNLLGVEFVSSLSGRTRLHMGPHLVETIVLDRILVQKLFLDIVGGQQHLLKPLAVQILDSIVSGMDDDEIKMAVVRALLRCEPRFDGKTKLKTVQSLLDTIDASCLDGYLSFLQVQVLRAEDGPTTGDSISLYQAVGYVDLMFYLGKGAIAREKGTEEESNVIPVLAQKVLDFFLILAFFDCSMFKGSTAALSSKKSKKRKSQDTVSPIQVAAMIHSTRSTSALPYQVRSVASARFFSLLSELVTAISHSAVHDKDSMILKLLTKVRRSCKTLQDAGAKRFDDDEEKDGDGMETDEEKSPAEIVEALYKHADIETEPQEELEARRRLSVGFAILSEAIFLHLLTCGQPENMMTDDDPDADDDEDKEEVQSILSDLYEIFEDFTKEDDEKMSNEILLGLAELCTNVLSSPLSSGNQSRGASPKLLREVVKILWTRALSLAAQDDLELGPNVISVLLQSVGAISEGEENEGDESSEGEGDESMDEGDDDGVFARAAKVQSDEEPDEASSSSSMDRDEQGSDEDIELDPARLQTMLEEDIDEASIEADELEHHEGADAALAKMIQLKQEARKAGQKARERLELSRQLRCTLLLEILASGRPEGWGALLRINTLFQIVFALLRYRGELEKSLAKASEKGTDVTHGEKKAMFDRITAILKGKLLKFRVASLKWSTDVDVGHFTDETASSLFTEARQTSSKDHQYLCSSAILLLIRAMDKEEDQLRIADMYGNTVEEWASKRTTRFDASFFDQLIHQAPSIAQACLPDALASAASTARSSFLKSEAFRLLAQLYNPKLLTSTSDADLANVARTKLSDASSRVLQSIAIALKDDEMKKTKRVREVLKAAEKLIAFLVATPGASVDEQLLGEVKELLTGVRDGTDSQGVRNSCDKLIQELVGLAGASEQQASQEGDASELKDANTGEQSQDNRSSKKKKKKSKKKKKR